MILISLFYVSLSSITKYAGYLAYCCIIHTKCSGKFRRVDTHTHTHPFNVVLTILFVPVKYLGSETSQALLFMACPLLSRDSLLRSDDVTLLVSANNAVLLSS